MKIVIVIFLFSFNVAFAQTTELYVGSATNSLVVKAGETLSVSGLTLNPTADFDLTNNQIIKATTVANTVNQLYVPLVYRFNSNTNSFTGSMVISYSGVTHSLNEANFKFHYHDGTRWNRDASSTVNTGTDIVTSSALSSIVLNELTISDVPTTLPVTWLSFTGRKQGDVVVLDWSTTTEQNTKDFEIEHSTNTQTWTILGTVVAAGNSNSIRNYTFTHHSPFKGSIYNYYRIKQRDLDGQFRYSRIVSLVYGEPGADLMVYPNPATTSLMVYLSSDEEVRITNLAGATIWKSNLPAGRHQISVAQFARGVYLLQVGNQWRKIVLQ